MIDRWKWGVLVKRIERAFKAAVVEERYIDGLAEAASKVGDIRICFNVSRYCWVVGGV